MGNEPLVWGAIAVVLIILFAKPTDANPPPGPPGCVLFPTCMPYSGTYALGNSITKGGALLEAQRWPKVLDTKLGSNTYNLGFDSHSCTDLLSHYQNEIPSGAGNTVIVECGINDIAGYSHTAAQTEADLEAIYDLSIAKGNKIVFMTIPPLIQYYPQFCPNILEVNAWLKNFTTSHCIPLVDYHGTFATDSTTCVVKPGLTVDGLHLSPSGAEILANKVWVEGFGSAHFEVCP